MKTLALIFSFFLTTTFIQAQDDSLKTYSITVKIDNAFNDDGSMLIGLHSEDTFMKGKGIDNMKSAIVDGKVEVTFEGLTPGTYAIMVFHDANDNGKMDFDTTGMPLESYGMSNNPMLYGPPSFADAKFDLDNDDLELIIRL
ncbi:DUF2141 domain-containing protein [Xanthomarina sp. F2636L]|uniref:DUF2141 domain-containing protein n=1 Tax=Xanthomarina sp. F2636L TaxID=2996018 RepID=UPI00225DCD8C|nr:DUF2141 domain-containing protein [Xanthomarina sp. F2636L]MCX7550105.1 DUF2141 domain-containing protein [Xanthomarina sp. F2636L]